eukprot:NODE_2835_length_1110_cov_27.264844_g2599_i0.p1 GENE.NODE_2835_length_1110_cov_27.264844_g2599_i0~~NODE_2835_length_1110_cov_27.264844_g2599_i0.p1  ORF type:complete len:324 (+),score=62.96 NODE_2835_length_1110_cov_27.264844_g2599_i0:30-1001(+)
MGQLVEYSELNDDLHHSNLAFKKSVDTLGAQVRELLEQNEELQRGNEELAVHVEQHKEANVSLTHAVDDMAAGVKLLEQRVAALRSSNEGYHVENERLESAAGDLRALVEEKQKLLGALREHESALGGIAQSMSQKVHAQRSLLDGQKQEEERVMDLIRELQVQRLNFLFDQLASDRTRGLSRPEFDEWKQSLDKELGAKLSTLSATDVDFDALADIVVGSQTSIDSTPAKRYIMRYGGFVRLRNKIINAPLPSGHVASYYQTRQRTHPRPRPSPRLPPAGPVPRSFIRADSFLNQSPPPSPSSKGIFEESGGPVRLLPERLT